MKVYERSPMMVFTRSPLRLYEPAPLGPQGRLMRFEPMKNGKPFRTAYVALAVVAIGLLLIGAAILLRPKPSVLAVNSIEMAIPEVHPASVEPAPRVEAPLIEKAQPQAEDKSAMPKAGDNSRNLAAAPMPKAPKASTTNSTNLDPKPSSPRKHFIYGATAGTDPDE